MNTRRNWIVLGVALVLGAAAAFLSLSYLNKQKAALAARANQTTEMVAVLVAKRPLSRGDALTGQTVAVRDVPKEYAHSLALKPGDFEAVDGQLLAYPLRPGEQVLSAAIVGGANAFSTRVEPGRRAVTLPVDEISSISGLVEPGDLIDLMLTLPNTGKRVAPIPILDGVEVMATGQRQMNDPRTGETRRYSTVTLNTTPDQARNVIAAREMGKLTALLRNRKDRPAGAVHEVDVTGGVGDLPSASPMPRMGRPGPVTPEVQVIYGGNGKPSTQGRILNPAGGNAQPSPTDEAQAPQPIVTPAPGGAR